MNQSSCDVDKSSSRSASNINLPPHDGTAARNVRNPREMSEQSSTEPPLQNIAIDAFINGPHLI